MADSAQFPGAIDEVTHWLHGSGQAVKRCPEKEIGQWCRVWCLGEAIPVLIGTSSQLMLARDFPLKPARIELSPNLCLRLPHVEFDGNLCHGVVFEPTDMQAPVAAVGRVLNQFDQFLRNCTEPGWVEAEFHRERQSYWSRQVASAKVPSAYRTVSLFLDVPPDAGVWQEAAAVHLSGSRVLATTATSEPESLAKTLGWACGSIVRGGALVVTLPLAERWTPSTWPKDMSQLDDLVSQLCDTPDMLRGWYGARRWPNKAPIFVVMQQGPATFGWQIVPAQFARGSAPVIIPVNVSRVDRQWSLSRDHHAAGLAHLTSKKVVVFGCGSLGAPVVELLARAGVGTIEAVDPQDFEAENISRHLMGASSIGHGKAALMCARLRRSIPGAILNSFEETAMQWLGKASQRARPDLILDCTGERSVRAGTSLLRGSLPELTAVMMAWMEPFCASAHVVLVAGNDQWPASDPAESSVNIAQWPQGVEVDLPGCGYGFHPYGAADAWKVAGLVAEKALSYLNGNEPTSSVWSMIRARQYFTDKSPLISFNRAFPVPAGIESIVEHRALSEVLQGA